MLATLSQGNDRPLNIGGLALVVGAHLLGLWGILAMSEIAPEQTSAAPLYVSFITPEVPEQVKPPEPLPPQPPPPLEKPKPKPLITTKSNEPAPQAIQAPPEPVEPEPLPPIQAAPPPAPGPAPEPAMEPPKLDAAYGNSPLPPYPMRSRQLGEEGVVELTVLVSVDGLPKSIKVTKSSGFIRLDDAAVTAVRRWKFKPGTKGGKPFEQVVTFPMPFSLNK